MTIACQPSSRLDQPIPPHFQNDAFLQPRYCKLTTSIAEKKIVRMEYQGPECIPCSSIFATFKFRQIYADCTVGNTDGCVRENWRARQSDPGAQRR